MVKYYRTWCPRGSECSKKDSQICRKDSHAGAMQYLENHLRTSWYHKDSMTNEDVELALLEANIKLDSESEAEEEAPGAALAAWNKYEHKNANAKLERTMRGIEKTVKGLSNTIDTLKRGHTDPDEEDSEPSTRALVKRAHTNMVSVPENALKSCAQSLGRSENMLRQAATMAMAASSAYTSEAVVMGQARDRIMDMIDKN